MQIVGCNLEFLLYMLYRFLNYENVSILDVVHPPIIHLKYKMWVKFSFREVQIQYIYAGPSGRAV